MGLSDGIQFKMKKKDKEWMKEQKTEFVRGKWPAVPTLVPTNDPKYIDSQVEEILEDMFEGPPLRPFVEGEPIAPASARNDNPGSIMMGLPLHEFNEMSACVWADHKRKTKAAHRRAYTTTRHQGGMTFAWTWVPERKLFNIVRGEVK